MTAFKGLGTYGNAAGVVTPLDMKLGLAGLITKTTTPLVIRPGLFYGGSASIVSGKANMSYDVAAYQCVTQRSASAGAVFGGNDGTLNLATDVTGAALAAPVSNSRYHLIFHWHREYSLDGTDSNPVIGVLQGVAAGSPTVPSLAAYPGAIELARILVPAGVTATNTGTTITQTAPFTAMDGAPYVVRTTAERDAITGQLPSQQVRCLADGLLYEYLTTSQVTTAGWYPIFVSPPHFKVIAANNQSHTSSGTWQLVNGAWGSAEFSKGITSFASGVLTIATAGLYEIAGGISINNGSAVRTGVQITKNTASVSTNVIAELVGISRHENYIAEIVSLAAGDALRMNAYQETGGATNIISGVKTHFSARYIGVV